jgi:hypothetical protein
MLSRAEFVESVEEAIIGESGSGFDMTSKIRLTVLQPRLPYIGSRAIQILVMDIQAL